MVDAIRQSLLGPPRILVVDDSAMTRRGLAELLTGAMGARVEEASEGASALRITLAEELDCVLCDMNMPVMDGMGFLRAARMRKSRSELPVLLVTAQSSRTDRVRALQAGASDFVVKPYEPDELIARVGNYVELARMYRQLTYLANTDALSGLCNRRAFLERIEECSCRMKRTQRSFSVLMLDIDHFKRVNDTHGHPVGDAVIAALGATLRGSVRGYDVVGRLGGEEMAVLLPDTALRDAVEVAERIRATVAASSMGGLPEGAVTVSIGVAEARADTAEPAAALLKLADDELYRAKHSGRNRVCSRLEPEGTSTVVAPAAPVVNASL
ncbi:MAG: diguanylate cyclase [Myxococcota bacterium]